MSSTLISVKDELIDAVSVIDNEGMLFVNDKEAKNEIVQVGEIQLQEEILPSNYIKIADSNITENHHNPVVQNIGIGCQNNTNMISMHVAPIQANCEINHKCSMLQTSGLPCQNKHSDSDILPVGHELQNANVSAHVNNSMMSPSSSLSCEKNNVRKRTFSQMKASEDLDNSDENSLSPVRKKRRHQNEFTENGSTLAHLSQARKNLNFTQINNNSHNQNNGILLPSESYGSLVPGDKSDNMRLTFPSNLWNLATQNSESLPQNESCGIPANTGQVFPGNQLCLITENNQSLPQNKPCGTPANTGQFFPGNQFNLITENNQHLPQNVSSETPANTGQIFPGNQLNLVTENNQRLPQNVPSETPANTGQFFPGNQLSLITENNRSLPQNELSCRETCLPLPQYRQSEISPNGIQPQVNVSQSSSLPYFHDQNQNKVEMNRGISSVDNWPEEDMEIDDSETLQPEMHSQQNNQRLPQNGPSETPANTGQIFPGNQLSLMTENNRSLPQNQLSCRETCLGLPQYRQCEYYGIQPQVNVSQSSSLPYFHDQNQNKVEVNRGIFSLDNWPEEAMEVDDSETLQPEMYSQQSSFMEKTEYHNYSCSVRIHPKFCIMYQQQQMTHFAYSNHSLGAKENKIEPKPFNQWIAGNDKRKNSNCLCNWPAVNGDETKYSLDRIGNSPQASVLPMLNAEDIHMDCTSYTPQQSAMFPILNADETASPMEWTAGNTCQVAEFPTMSSDVSDSYMDWSNENSYRANELLSMTMDVQKEISHCRVNLANSTSTLERQKLSCKIKKTLTRKSKKY